MTVQVDGNVGEIGTLQNQGRCQGNIVRQLQRVVALPVSIRYGLPEFVFVRTFVRKNVQCQLGCSRIGYFAVLVVYEETDFQAIHLFRCIKIHAEILGISFMA